MSLKDKRIYPTQLQIADRRGAGIGSTPANQPPDGITLLEYYAGLIMQGELSAQGQDYCWAPSQAQKLAQHCVEFAKALIEALEKEQQS